MMSQIPGKQMMVKLLAVCAVVIAGFLGPAQAHEFWIEPVDFTPASDEPLVANIRTGQMLKGDPSPYIRSFFVAFVVTYKSAVGAVTGSLGDRPALNVQPGGDGLHIAAYQSVPSVLRYKKREKFEKFVRKEGFAWVLEAHDKRGLPEEGFKEGYTRFAKSLIASGNAEGNDRELGLRIELIALTNPYTDAGPIKVQVLFERKPLEDVQIAIFRRDAEGEVTRETLRSDGDGRAVIARKDAETTLLSAVHMVEPDEALAKRKNVVWHSLWASLTYGASAQ